jgi:hypothetical protein
MALATHRSQAKALKSLQTAQAVKTLAAAVTLHA